MKSVLHKRADGQITVFASIVLVLVIAVVCGAIKSAWVSAAKTAADMACSLSVESVFAQYSTDLLNEFDVLYFEKTDVTDAKLKSYIQENSKYNTGFASKQLQSLEINELVRATDNGGDSIKREVLEYMKYGILSEAAKTMLQSESQVEKTEKTKEIVEEVTKCEESAAGIDNIVLQLISIVEGVKTNENGFVPKDGNPQATQENFVKELCLGKASMQSTAVYDERIYKAMESEYFNIYEILEDMKNLTEYILTDGDKESETGGINSYSSVFERCQSELKEKLESEILCMQKAINILNGYDEQIENLSGAIRGIMQDIEGKRAVIGNELADVFQQDMSELETSRGGQSVTMCDTEKMLDALRYNLQILNETKVIAESMNYKLCQDNAEGTKLLLSEFNDSISRYDNSELVFDYSKVSFGTESQGLGAVKKVQKFLSDGILNLTIPDTSKISKKEINYTNLASVLKNEGREEESIVESGSNNALYNEYLFLKFKSYTDSIDSDGKAAESSALLDYMVEYILYGKGNDHDNLENAVVQLSLMREAVNLVYLFTDGEKKKESYALSLSLLGFTGNYAVVKAGQYFIMAVWAYGESLVDVRRLCCGERVEMIKNRNSWQLSLQNLLEMNLNGHDTEKKENKGLNYEEYLRMMMFMKNKTDKYFRTMDAMELKMIEKGHQDFRMKDYIYSMKAVAEFKIKWIPSGYRREMYYSY